MMQRVTHTKQYFVNFITRLLCLLTLVLFFHSCFFDKDIKQDAHISAFRADMLGVLDSLDNSKERIAAFYSILESIKNDKDIITDRKRDNVLIEGLFYISGEYYRLRDFDNTIKVCNEALKLNPQNAKAYFNRGVAYQAKQDLDSALNDYTKSIDLDSEYCDAYYNRGIVYEKKQQYNQALMDYDKVVKLKPVYIADVYIGRGNAYRGLSNSDRAIENYGKALQADSTKVEAYSNRGSVFADLEKYDEALADYQKAIEIDSLNADIFNRRGYTFELMNDYDNALDNYERVLKLDPKDKNGYKKLAKDGIDRVKKDKRKGRK